MSGGLRDVETPALVVDLEVLESNLAAMAEHAEALGVRLRPHAKTHKSAAIARRQVAAGASGLTVATVGEAERFASLGLRDLFIAYPVLARGSKGARLALLAERTALRVGVESAGGAEAIAAALAGSRCGVGVLVEVDSGQHRTGIAPERAGEVASACRRVGLEVLGAFTHGGHAYAGRGAVTAAARDEEDALSTAADALGDVGIEVAELSAGSTPTARVGPGGATGGAWQAGSGRSSRPAGHRVTELRPGTYAFNDRQQLALGACGSGELALRVLASVVSTTRRGWVVLDAGSKALASDRSDWLAGYGEVPELGGAMVTSLTEHHGIVELGEATTMPAVGDVVSVVPNHACTVVNLFDRYVVVRGGEPVGLWPVDARGLLA